MLSLLPAITNVTKLGEVKAYLWNNVRGLLMGASPKEGSRSQLGALPDPGALARSAL